MSEREQEAIKTVKNYMWVSAGAGMIPVPWADLAAVAAVQMKLLAALSKIYGIPFKASVGKSAIASMVGFVLPHAISFGAVGCLLKFIPVVGALPGAAWQGIFCSAYTWAIGNVFIQHFESGGTFLDFNSEKVKEYFKAQFEEGRKMATAMDKEEKAAVPVNSLV